MVTVHENGKVWKVQLRGRYSGVRSEKAFRALIQSGIDGLRKSQPAVAASLEQKSLWFVVSYFGLVTNKWEVK